MKSATTVEDANNALRIAAAIAEAIQSLGEVPSGHLYAQVMGRMDIHTYNAIIETLIKVRLVRREQSHLLVWIGPKK